MLSSLRRLLQRKITIGQATPSEKPTISPRTQRMFEASTIPPRILSHIIAARLVLHAITIEAPNNEAPRYPDIRVRGTNPPLEIVTPAPVIYTSMCSTCPPLAIVARAWNNSCKCVLRRSKGSSPHLSTGTNGKMTDNATEMKKALDAWFLPTNFRPCLGFQSWLG